MEDKNGWKSNRRGCSVDGMALDTIKSGLIPSTIYGPKSYQEWLESSEAEVLSTANDKLKKKAGEGLEQ